MLCRSSLTMGLSLKYTFKFKSISLGLVVVTGVCGEVESLPFCMHDHRVVCMPYRLGYEINCIV